MRRVVITGIGLITPLGISAQSTWKALIAGETAVRHTHHHDSLPVQLAATISRDDLPKLPPLLSPCPPFAAYALLAAHEALLDARLLSSDDYRKPYDSDRCGVSIGVGMAHLPDIATTSAHLDRNAYRKVSPYLVPRILPNTPAGLVSLRHALRGPVLTPATACAAGSHAVADGLHTIQRGDADVMVVGGTEAAIHPIAVAGFARARALATEADSAPFDRNRSGFVLGEGAGIIILESLDHAIERNATAYAEMVGAASTGDAHHITSPSPDGNGAFRAMQTAIRASNRLPKDVDYVNAHATGTPVGDLIERTAIANLLPKKTCAFNAVVSATKGATGHLLGAAGAVEAAFTILSLAHDIIPPTVGLNEIDDVGRLNDQGWGDERRYIPHHSLEKSVTGCV